MDWIESSVRTFGQSMGLSHLSLDEEGLAALELQGDSELALQDLHPLGGNEFLVSLVKPFTGDPQRGLRAAMKAADYRHGSPWAVQIGLDEHDLLVTLRIPRSALMPSSLEEAVNRLVQFHREVGHGV